MSLTGYSGVVVPALHRSALPAGTLPPVADPGQHIASQTGVWPAQRHTEDSDSMEHTTKDRRTRSERLLDYGKQAVARAAEAAIGVPEPGDAFVVAVASQDKLIAVRGVSESEAEIIHRILFPGLAAKGSGLTQ